MIKVTFKGPLAKLCPEPIRVAADTVAKAVDAATRQVPAFKPNAARGRMLLRVRGFDSVQSLMGGTDATEVEVWPALAGGGGKGLFKIVIGVALIVASFYVPGIGAAIGVEMTAATAATIASATLSLGISMVLGGVMELMSAAPKYDVGAAANIEASKYLGAGGNTVKIGTRIPLLYGTHRAAGHYISFNIEAVDVAPSAT